MRVKGIPESASACRTGEGCENHRGYFGRWDRSRLAALRFKRRCCGPLRASRSEHTGFRALPTRPRRHGKTRRFHYLGAHRNTRIRLSRASFPTCLLPRYALGLGSRLRRGEGRAKEECESDSSDMLFVECADGGGYGLWSLASDRLAYGPRKHALGRRALNGPASLVKK